MICLAVDTSSKYLCIVLIKDNKVIASYNRVKERMHGQLLIPEIEKLLKKNKVLFKEIDCLAVDAGPGSFTGLRIGISAVKGLAMALDVPVISVCSLDLLAVNCVDQSNADIICPLVDAKRKQVYAALFKISKGALKKQGKYFLGPVDELVKKIKSPVVFCGDAIGLYQQDIQQLLKTKACFAKESLWYTKPESFAKVCFDKFKNKDYQRAENLVPIYLYSHTCTVRKKQKTKK